MLTMMLTTTTTTTTRTTKHRHRHILKATTTPSSSSSSSSTTTSKRVKKKEQDEDTTTTTTTTKTVSECLKEIGRKDDNDVEALRITEVLRQNWYDDVEQVKTAEEWLAMKLPLKLYNQILLVQRSNAVDDDDCINTANDDDDNELDRIGREKIDGWIGGELPLTERIPLESRTYFETNNNDDDDDDDDENKMKKMKIIYKTNRRPDDVPMSEKRVTLRKRLPDYAISEKNLPKTLKKELNKFVRDLTTRRVGSEGNPVRAETVRKHRDVARALCGYIINVKNADNNNKISSLIDAFPSPTAEGAELAIEYMQWLVETRGILNSTEHVYMQSLVAIAKWLYPPYVSSSSNGEEVNSAIVKELLRLQRNAKARAEVAPRAADESKKWLDWPQYLMLVECLKLECAGLNKRGEARKKADIARSIQLYLFFAILACVPDRQRTLRELELNRTLFFDSPTKTWYIKHNANDYKTGSIYGTRPNLVLDRRLYPALEAWLHDGYRDEFNPNHNFVFTRPNGEPYTVSELSRAFSRCALRVTGQKVNPHLVRDMIITYVRGQGVASDNELEALAIYMGHSSQMQKGTYDRRSSSQKVAPAVELMTLVNSSATTQTNKYT